MVMDSMESSGDVNGQLLHFSIGQDHYLLGIDIIQEILEYRSVTPVPSMPDVIHGVINLRGQYIPVFDMARRLALDKQVVGKRSCIVVVECHDGDDKLAIGLLVDKVNRFVSIDPAAISEPPRFGHTISADLIDGMIQIDDLDYIILRIDKLLNLHELIELLQQSEDTLESQMAG